MRRWTREFDHLQPEAANKMREWLGEAGENKLSDWDISRDAPYFGFEIPDAPGKYFYVWLDAPIGYMGSFKKFCEQKSIDFDQFWQKMPRPNFTISLVKIFCIFMRYFGLRCWKTPVTVPQQKFLRTAS